MTPKTLRTLGTIGIILGFAIGIISYNNINNQSRYIWNISELQTNNNRALLSLAFWAGLGIISKVVTSKMANNRDYTLPSTLRPNNPILQTGCEKMNKYDFCDRCRKATHKMSDGSPSMTLEEWLDSPGYQAEASSPTLASLGMSKVKFGMYAKEGDVCATCKSLLLSAT